MNYRIITPTQILFVRKDINGTFIVELDEIDIYMKEGVQTKVIKKKNVEVTLENLVAGKINEIDMSNKLPENIPGEVLPALEIQVTESAPTTEKFG